MRRTEPRKTLPLAPAGVLNEQVAAPIDLRGVPRSFVPAALAAHATAEGLIALPAAVTVTLALTKPPARGLVGKTRAAPARTAAGGGGGGAALVTRNWSVPELFCGFGSGSSELAVTVKVYEPGAAARISHRQLALAVPPASSPIGFVQTTDVSPLQPSVGVGVLAKLRPLGKVVRTVMGRGTPVLPSTSTTSRNVSPCTSATPTPCDRKTIVERSSAVGRAEAAPTTRSKEATASAAT